MKILTVTGYKGGVAKSTTAIHLATYFSEKGNTLLIDGDERKTCLKWATRSPTPDNPLFEVVDERKAVKAVQNKDFIIIDTSASPESDDLKELADGCDLMILPTIPDVFSFEQMVDTTQALDDANYRALITVNPPRPSKEGEILRSDLENEGIPIFKTMISRTTGYGKAALMGVPIRDMNVKAFRDFWKDYKALGKEITEILK